MRTLARQMWVPKLVRFMRVRARYNATGADHSPYLIRGHKPSRTAVRIGLLYILLLIGTLTALFYVGDPDQTDLPPRRASSARGGSATSSRAYSYVSVVDGQARRHATWADCERRVKGRSGARFKKAASASEEAAILRGWNIDPRSVEPNIG